MANRLIKLTSVFLTTIMILLALAACNNSANNETDGSDTSETNDSTNTSDQLDLSMFPENAFPIFDGNAYTLKVVCSDTANEAERSVAAKFRATLKGITKASLSPSTDFLMKGESFNSNTYEILVGETKHEESVAVYKDIPYNNYGIKVIGKKMVFYFSSIAEGEELISLFISAIRTEKGGVLWVPDTMSASKTSSIQLINIPKYPALSLTNVDCEGDTSMVVAKNTNLATFNEYCTTLVNNGYAEYSKRDVEGNSFRAFTKGNNMVYTYFSAGTKQTRIIVGPIKDLPSKEIDTTPETVTPSISFVAQSNSTGNGLALIYQLPNGKFIIADGGYYLSDKIYKKLKELQPDTSKITIAAWFISHPHGDHQETLEKFIAQHGNEIAIESIFFNYINYSYYDNLTEEHEESNKEGHSVSRLNNLILTKLPRSTKIIKPHTGQVYNFGESTQVEILYTIEDYLPTTLDRINTSSMIIRITVDGTSTMILADATSVTNSVVLKMYDSHLKSDIVTLAHHGIWVDTPEMYKKVDAKVLLWPSNTTEANNYYNQTYSKPAIQAALDAATDVYLAMGTDNKFELPYTFKNNKEAFMGNILNQ